MSLLALIVLILASFRITRIFVDDTITEPYRMWFVRWHEKTHSKASHFFLTLITCPWCLGWWVSGSATLVYFLGVEDWPGLLEFLFWWAAVAGGAAISSTTVYRLETDD